MALGLAYRQSMRQMAVQTNLEVWYSHIDVESAQALLKEEAQRTKAKDVAAHGGHRRQGRGQGAHQGQHEGARQADHRGRRRSAAS